MIARSCVESPLGIEMPADGCHVRSEFRSVMHCQRSWSWQVYIDDVHDSPRTWGHDRDTIREVNRFGYAVRDEQDGLPAAAPNSLELLVHRIERAERLVHQQERWIVNQRPAYSDALLHPTRQLGGILVLETRQGGHFDELPGTRAGFAFIPLLDFDRNQDVLQYGAPRQQHGGLEHHADLPAWTAQSLARHVNITRGALEHSR